VSQINDCIIETIGAGQINDDLLRYYKLHGATSNDLNDAEYQFLVASGIAATQLNDMWALYLTGKGLSGTLADMKTEFWCNNHAPFPPLSDSVIFEANIEDGVPGTIVAVYNDDLALTTPFSTNSFRVMINGVRATIDGISIDPVFFDNLIIVFHPRVYAGDVVTFQYDARVDPGFTDDIQKKPINNVINPVTNGELEASANDFGGGFGGGYT